MTSNHPNEIRNVAAEASAPQSGSRKRKAALIAAALLSIAAAVALAAALISGPDVPQDRIAKSTSGIEIVDAEGMSDEEIQAMLDAKARESMMDISFGSVLTLDGNELTVTFTNSEKNAYAQRFVLEQGGETVFVSEGVDPGYRLTSVGLTPLQAQRLHSGSASVTITSLDENGEPFGNGAEIDVEIRK